MSVAVQCADNFCLNFGTAPSGHVISRTEKALPSLRSPESASATLGLRLDMALSELVEVCRECSSDDWDGYGAPAVSRDAMEEAKKILRLLPSSIPMPEITADAMGDIGLEWVGRGGRAFVIGVNGKNRITYAGIFGEDEKVHGTSYLGDTLPSPVWSFLQRLLS